MRSIEVKWGHMRSNEVNWGEVRSQEVNQGKINKNVPVIVTESVTECDCECVMTWCLQIIGVFLCIRYASRMQSSCICYCVMWQLLIGQMENNNCPYIINVARCIGSSPLDVISSVPINLDTLNRVIGYLEVSDKRSHNLQVQPAFVTVSIYFILSVLGNICAIILA